MLDSEPPELGVRLGRAFRLVSLAPGTYRLGVMQHARGEPDRREEIASASFEVLPGAVVRGVHVVADVAEAP